MKIALLCSKFPPDVGGGETHIRDLADGLAAAGHAVDVGTGTDCAAPPGARYRVEPIAGLRGFAEGHAGIGPVVPALDAWIARSRPDVLHVFNHLPSLAVGLIRSRVACPVVISLFETFEPGRRLFDLWRVFDLERSVQRSILALVAHDRWICGSRAYERWAHMTGVEPTSCTVVPFGVDTRRFRAPTAEERAAARRLFGVAPEVRLIGFPSRIVPRKRAEDLLHALGRVADPHVRLLVPAPTATSDAPYVRSIRELIAALRLDDRVCWTPEPCVVDSMPAFYAACDLVVQPASAEGLGIALLEAMSMGVIVATSDIEGHDEVVRDGDTGFLFAAQSAESIAGAIERVLAAGDLDAMRARARRAVIEGFSIESMVAGHLAVYRELAAARTQRKGRVA